VKDRISVLVYKPPLCCHVDFTIVYCTMTFGFKIRALSIADHIYQWPVTFLMILMSCRSSSYNRGSNHSRLAKPRHRYAILGVFTLSVVTFFRGFNVYTFVLEVFHNVSLLSLITMICFKFVCQKYCFLFKTTLIISWKLQHLRLCFVFRLKGVKF
jgi:hypothetical protein